MNQLASDSPDWWIGQFRVVEVLDAGRSLTDAELADIGLSRGMVTWISREGWRFDRAANTWTPFDSVISQDSNRVLVNLGEPKVEAEITSDGPDRLKVTVLGLPALVTVLERTSAGAAVAELTPSGNLKARVPEGTVELVAISRHPTDGVWWRPDGRLALGQNFVDTGKFQSFTGQHTEYESVWRHAGWPEGSFSARLKNSGGTFSSGVTTATGERLTNHFAATSLPLNLKTTELVLQVDAGPWKTVLDDRDGGTSSTTLRIDGIQQEVSLAEAGTNGERNLFRTVVHDLDPGRWSARLVVEAFDGNVVEPVAANTAGRGMTSIYRNLKAADVLAWKFKVRPVHELRFPNIRLAPANESKGNKSN